MAYGQAIQALADPTRRAIFERLRSGPQPVGQLAEGLHVSRPAVSQHLKVLEGAGLVSARRDGTRRIYGVEIKGLEELRSYLDRFWDDVLEHFWAAADRDAPTRGGSPSPPSHRGRSPSTRRPRRKHGRG